MSGQAETGVRMSLGVLLLLLLCVCVRLLFERR